MLDRRTFLMSAASIAALSAGGRPSLAFAQDATGPAAALNALMERGFQELILADPETRTSLGLDSGPNAAAKSQLLDRSLPALRARQQQMRRFHTELQTIDRARLSGMDAVNYDTIKHYGDTVVGAYNAFEYGTHSWPEPYTVSQLGGTYQAIPDFLDSQHRIDTAADADAYLSRLSSFARQLDSETERLRREYGMGVVPPDFVIDKTLLQLGNLTGTAPAQSVLVTSLGRRTG